MAPACLTQATVDGEVRVGQTSGEQTAEHVLRLIDRGLDRSVRIAGLILGDRADAEDAVQEAAMRAWRSAASLRDLDGAQAWLDRILVNVCRDRLRRRNRVRFVPLDGLVDAHVDRDPFRAALDRDETLRAINVLDADQRVVVVLHYWADLTLAAVAERTGWPIGTVKTRLHQALERMRRGAADTGAREIAR
jgi:RNA polymerase sigma-70 factor, ECF subfamily